MRGWSMITYRGMIVDVPLMLGAMPGKPTPDAIRACLGAAYAGTPLVNLVEDFDVANLTVEQAAGTDRLDLFVFANADGSQARLVAALDNLGKGAGGACVQSLNILAGLPETAGLRA
jgi:N-acetyl-gamma-glutamyl-phosphate reductase